MCSFNKHTQQLALNNFKWVFVIHGEMSYTLSSVAQPCLILSDPMNRSTRLPCPSQTPRVYSNSCPSSWWCHPAISSSVILLPPIPPSIRVFSNELTLCMRWPNYWSFSFSISPSMNTQDLSPSGGTGWISLQSKGLSEPSPTPQFKSVNSSMLRFL